ncbi:hypothetical protein, partial [Brachyspira pilosicoli]|uniref:hypothetical protein n=1 Tax=Brachyspira pilosicoli TaxID=52584 RepID=UPI002666D90B
IAYKLNSASINTLSYLNKISAIFSLHLFLSILGGNKHCWLIIHNSIIKTLLISSLRIFLC